MRLTTRVSPGLEPAPRPGLDVKGPEMTPHYLLVRTHRLKDEVKILGRYRTYEEAQQALDKLAVPGNVDAVYEYSIQESFHDPD